MGRFELPTSPLPRECSTPELHGQNFIRFGAGEGNRTLVISLEGFCSTIELHPPLWSSYFKIIMRYFALLYSTYYLRLNACYYSELWRLTLPVNRIVVEGEGFEPSKLSQQIYSLPPLTARESLRQRMGDYIRVCVKRQVEVYFIVLCFVFIVKNIFSGCLNLILCHCEIWTFVQIVAIQFCR